MIEWFRLWRLNRRLNRILREAGCPIEVSGWQVRFVERVFADE